MDYRPTGVCSQLIRVELDGDTIKNVEFIGGCNGNTTGCHLPHGGNHLRIQDHFLPGPAGKSSENRGKSAEIINIYNKQTIREEGYSSDLRTGIPLPCKSIFHFDKIILGSLHVTIGLSPTEILQDMLLLL